MFFISSYYYYRVNISYKWCSRDEYDYDIDEYIFNNHKYKISRKMEGGELINLIAQYFNGKYVVDVSFEDNKIYISNFDPFSGETDDIKIVFKQLKKFI